jgi:hypothetical protein
MPGSSSRLGRSSVIDWSADAEGWAGGDSTTGVADGGDASSGADRTGADSTGAGPAGRPHMWQKASPSISGCPQWAQTAAAAAVGSSEAGAEEAGIEEASGSSLAPHWSQKTPWGCFEPQFWQTSMDSPSVSTPWWEAIPVPVPGSRGEYRRSSILPQQQGPCKLSSSACVVCGKLPCIDPRANALCVRSELRLKAMPWVKRRHS